MVREEDVRALLADLAQMNARPTNEQAPTSTHPHASPASHAGLARVERIVPLSAVKRTEVRYLRTGNADALVSAITVAVGATGLDRRIAATTERRLTYLSFVLPVVARALRNYPELNAFLEDDGIHFYTDVNVGVAINLGEGLFVPVIQQADRLNNEEVARAIPALIMKSARGDLREADLVGGTFTVTDLTDAGATQVFPLLNRYQSSILGIGFDGQGDDRRLLLTLAFDHRVSDGLQAAQFLGTVKQELESVDGPRVQAATGPACSSCRTSLRRLREDGVCQYLISIVKEHGEPALLCPTCLLGFTG
jgi:pyruvate/2-oxoglutarate dehydrogenase complex dihydrolipoamide acyltransferase (E2) component